MPGPPRGLGANKAVADAVRDHFIAARGLAFGIFNDRAKGEPALPPIDENDVHIPELDALLGMDEFNVEFTSPPPLQRPASAPPIMAPVTAGMLPSFSPKFGR